MHLKILKLNLLTKLNHLHIITLLLDNITFLKDQLHHKDKVIDSLINQFLQ